MSSPTVRSDDITGPVDKELGLVEEELTRIFSPKLTLISAVGHHLASAKGKRIRPILVLLSAKIGRPDLSEAIKVATSIELIHTATLLHDDSIDRSGLRRGVPTVNRLWNDQVSVIMGDHLFCTAFKILHEAGLCEAARVLAAGSDSVTYGEMFQMDLRGRPDVSEQTYLDMIGRKTASLFASACEAGAVVGRLTEDERAKLKIFGDSIGTAFQIIDDILDFVGDEDLMGKPVGNDLRDRRITLPLIVALRNADSDEKARIGEILRADEFDTRYWDDTVAFVRNKGGIEYCRGAAGDLVKKAKTQLTHLQQCPARDSLTALADRVVSRQK
jgi:octaprenyl-diphosphate synthase